MFKTLPELSEEEKKNAKKHLFFAVRFWCAMNEKSQREGILSLEEVLTDGKITLPDGKRAFPPAEDAESGKHINPQFKNYKQRVIDYLAESTDCEAVNKIKNIEPLNEKDIQDLQHILCEELGTREDYDAISEGASLGAFVRRIVGLNPEAVTKLLSEYLSKYNFNPAQEEFLHQIVTFVLQNGDIEVKNLIKDDPFKSLDFTDLFDGNIVPVTEFVSHLHKAIAA